MVNFSTHVSEVDQRVSSREQISIQWVDNSTEPAERPSRNVLWPTTLSSNLMPPAFLSLLGIETEETTFLGLEAKKQIHQFLEVEALIS